VHATGFSDQSHLTRYFKRIVGVTPGRYAQAVCGIRAGNRVVETRVA
jgi:AraC-like DNA-binding protein